MILDTILAHKRREVDLLKRDHRTESMIRTIDRLPPARSLARALKRPGRVALLAEVKGASPSKGIIREKLNPAEIAQIYTGNGADAISVLTDGKFFGGCPEHLAAVRESTLLPVIRKDFIIDPVQLYQARLIGADAALLICAALTPGDLRALIKLTEDLGMEALVEVHSEDELEEAVEAGAGIIGINNRDLKTFKTDISTTLRLCRRLKGGSAVIVSESGIKTPEDMKALRNAGVDAALVGEALMRAEDIGAKVRELRYGR